MQDGSGSPVGEDYVVLVCARSSCARRNRVEAARRDGAVCGHCGTPLPHAAAGPAGGVQLAGVLSELERKWGSRPAPSTRADEAAARRAAEAEAFVGGLERISWFANLGRPHPRDHQVVRLADWDAWPGPDVRSISLLHERQGELNTGLMESSANPERARALFDRTCERVAELAAKAVPYNPDEDSWHGPTLAVHQAGYTAALLAVCLLEGRIAPAELRQQWLWYEQGHWPAGYASLDDEGEPGPLLVY